MTPESAKPGSPTVRKAAELASQGYCPSQDKVTPAEPDNASGSSDQNAHGSEVDPVSFPATSGAVTTLRSGLWITGNPR
jgi:hypothetical protein